MSVQEKRIADLFTHDINRRIEEVIKVDQVNEDVVAAELSEYVTTEKIREDFTRLVERFRETPQKPHEGIGIWVSGFFGSGKSSFAKVLGYVLENRQVKGDRAVDLFLNRLPGAGSEKLRIGLREIAAKIPTTAVIFDVSTDRGAKTGSERITALMYKAFLRDLGYSQDFNLAELEISLEVEGRLEEFEQRFETVFKQPWRKRRALIAFAVNEASRIMHEMDTTTYPAADSWAKGLQKVDIDIDPNRFAERVLKLAERRRDGRTIVFVIDEVGQYVARSTDKMLDLQGVIQALGAKGRGKAWVVVTSQERLEEIVSSLDSKRIELARLRDRFPVENRVDLVPSDIAEVTGTRVLAKKANIATELQQLYDGVKGQLSVFTKLDGTARYPGLDGRGFANLYPFLPYQIDLIIDVISGLRLQAGGSTHTGGSSRTIIKLAQQAIVDDRVGLGDRKVGPLVTLDLIYDLIVQFITPDRRQDIERIERDFPVGDYPLVAKVAKAITLLEHVKNVKRSPETLAAVLHPDVKSASLAAEVQQVLEKLKEAQWIEEGEHGWQLLSPQGKQWATARQSLATPKEFEYTRYKKELLEQVLAGVKDYRHKGHRTFRPTIQVHGDILGSAGDISVEVVLADQPQWDAARKEILEKSRESQQVYWVSPINDDLYRELEEYHRSKLMIDSNKREAKERGLQVQLEAENRRLERHATDAKNRLINALMAGDTYFAGVKREAASLADQHTEVLAKLFTEIVPQLYPKFDLAAVHVKESDIVRAIDDKNLGSLPDVYYTGAGRLGLVVKEGGTFKPNPQSELAGEVFDFIKRGHRPPEKVTGKMLLEHFRGIGYGWDPEPLRMVTAVLLRAGTIEITAAGQRIQSNADPGAREVFATTPAFRSASFAPKSGGAEWGQIVDAATCCTKIFGDNVPFENSAVVAEAIKAAFVAEKDNVLKVQASLAEASLPGKEALDDYLKTFSNIVTNSTDDLILSFLSEETSIREGHSLTVRLEKELVPATATAIQQARKALQIAWRALEGRPEAESVAETAQRLSDNLRSVSWFDHVPDIKTDAVALKKAYLDVYQKLYSVRQETYSHALEAVKGHAKWTQLTEQQQEQVLAPIQSRIGIDDPWAKDDLPAQPTLGEMESHLDSVESLKSKAFFEIERLTTPEVKIERVRVARFTQGVTLETQEDLEAVLEQVRDHCAKVLSTGARVILE